MTLRSFVDRDPETSPGIFKSTVVAVSFDREYLDFRPLNPKLELNHDHGVWGIADDFPGSPDGDPSNLK